MKEIRIAYLGVERPSAQQLEAILCLEKSKYYINETHVNPDYLLVPISHLWHDINVWNEFKRLYSNDRIVIFWGDEAIIPDLNLFDYAISYDDSVIAGDRVIHYPNSSRWPGIESLIKGNMLTTSEAKELYRKRAFCNFIYSNPYSNMKRDELFKCLNVYKKVDSLGKHLNNCPMTDTNLEDGWFERSVAMKSNYRFSISSENSSVSGYTSEKIVSALIAHSIPIYWGNENIGMDFNEDAFINATNMNEDELLELVKIIDNDEKTWCEMVTRPWRLDWQVENARKNYRKYRDFCNNIFSQDVTDAKRVPQGTWIWEFQRAFLDREELSLHH